jgi:hypothetical protein
VKKQLKTTYIVDQGQGGKFNFSQATACPPARLLRIILYGTFNSEENSTTNVFDGWMQSLIAQEEPFTEQNSLFGVKRFRDSYPVIYTSAIALRLAPSLSQPVSEVAELIVRQIEANCDRITQHNPDPILPVEVLDKIRITSTNQGYIRFNFTDVAISNYLNLLIQFLPDSFKFYPPLSWHTVLAQGDGRIFQFQHTHARCCSILRLAQEHGMIQLNHQACSNGLEYWQLVSPPVLVWLTDTLQWQTNHPTELQLIASIITTLDALADLQIASFPVTATASFPRETDLKKEVLRLFSVAEGLSQAFHINHQHWQLMGNFRTQPCDRQHAHLGLILITQRLLYHVLYNQLGIEAPFEL